ncbi:MAG: nitroreductase [Rhodothermia bacterium]|nr:nitroreductase [Rhodothermia bacterium]
MSKSESRLIFKDPWTVDEQEFPAQGPVTHQLLFALNYAVLAPSGHNTQPWLFRLGDDFVDVIADRSRALAVVDPEDRELIMSCGTAAFHLQTTLRHYGLDAEIERFPDPTDPDLLARISVGGASEPSLTEHRLFMAIKKRHTNRQSFDDRKVPEIELQSMQEAVAAEGVTLDLFTDDAAKGRLGEIIAQGDRVQGQNRHFRRELSAWIRPNLSRRRDGIPGYAVGVGDAMSLVGPLVVRTFDWGDGQAARDEQLAKGSPILSVLSTTHDNAAAWLATGIALDHVLLLAADYSIQASYLNQPLEIPELRTRVAGLLERNAFPQIILRMGYGRLSKATPRRPVSEVLVDD